MARDCGTDDPELVQICQSVPEATLVLAPGKGLVDRHTTLGEQRVARLDSPEEPKK